MILGTSISSTSTAGIVEPALKNLAADHRVKTPPPSPRIGYEKQPARTASAMDYRRFSKSEKRRRANSDPAKGSARLRPGLKRTRSVPVSPLVHYSWSASDEEEEEEKNYASSPTKTSKSFDLAVEAVKNIHKGWESPAPPPSVETFAFMPSPLDSAMSFSSPSRTSYFPSPMDSDMSSPISMSSSVSSMSSPRTPPTPLDTLEECDEDDGDLSKKMTSSNSFGFHGLGITMGPTASLDLSSDDESIEEFQARPMSIRRVSKRVSFTNTVSEIVIKETEEPKPLQRTWGAPWRIWNFISSPLTPPSTPPRSPAHQRSSMPSSHEKSSVRPTLQRVDSFIESPRDPSEVKSRRFQTVELVSPPPTPQFFNDIMCSSRISDGEFEFNPEESFGVIRSPSLSTNAFEVDITDAKKIDPVLVDSPSRELRRPQRAQRKRAIREKELTGEDDITEIPIMIPTSPETKSTGFDMPKPQPAASMSQRHVRHWSMQSQGNWIRRSGEFEKSSLYAIGSDGKFTYAVSAPLVPMRMRTARI
jgi:hypothetical protein